MKRLTYLFASIIGVFVPVIASAHVKWFAKPEEYVKAYSLSDPYVVTGVICGILILIIGFYLEKRVSVPKSLRSLIEKLAPYALSLASVGFGLAFIIFSLKGFIFAPNLPAIGSMGKIMISIQAVAGVMMVLGFYERVAGLMLILLFVLAVGQYGALEMLDTLEMLGFAFYVMIIGRPKWKIAETSVIHTFTHHLHKYGYPLLRVGTGLNLIVLGFTEKILNPSLTQNFLATYHWNFMHTLGLSDYHFAFYAGLVEVLFGVFFLFGLITRITTITLAVFLVTTLVLLGPIELVGHLPHFSIAIVLLILGSGSELTFYKKQKS